MLTTFYLKPFPSGVAHGEDIFLIYGIILSNFPNSESEATVSTNLINMYYNFSKNNSAIYGGLKIDKSEPDDIKYLEISSATEFGMKQMNENFGNLEFWDQFEETIHSEESPPKSEL